MPQGLDALVGQQELEAVALKCVGGLHQVAHVEQRRDLEPQLVALVGVDVAVGKCCNRVATIDVDAASLRAEQ